MKHVHVLLALALLAAPAAAPAQDTLPQGDVQVFSAFHARLLAVSEVGAWGADRLADGRSRSHAKWMASYTAKFAKSVEEFLGEHGGAVQAIGEDTLIAKARHLPRELDGASGQALDSLWARRVHAWLDEARVQAIFIDSKRLQHKKSRGREASLRWAWGEPYARTCAMRRHFEKRLSGQECGPPQEPPSAASR